MRTQRIIIMKRHGHWFVFLAVRIAGTWFQYAEGIAETWAEVPATADAVWEMRPNHGED